MKSDAKTNLLRVLVLVTVVILVGCGRTTSTTPALPNALKVVNIDNLGGQNRGSFQIYGSYSNYDDVVARMEGTVFLGDGASLKMEGTPYLDKKTPNGSWEWGRAYHEYPVDMRGSAVRVRVEAVAHYQSGDVEALPVFEKEFILP